MYLAISIISPQYHSIVRDCHLCITMHAECEPRKIPPVSQELAIKLDSLTSPKPNSTVII